jgi:hypothetical protein
VSAVTDPGRIHPLLADPLTFARGVLARIGRKDGLVGERFVANDNVRWWHGDEWTSFSVHAVGTTFRFVDTDADVMLNVHIDKERLERAWYVHPDDILPIIEAIEPVRDVSDAMRTFAVHAAALAADDLRGLETDPTGCSVHFSRPLGENRRTHLLVKGPDGRIIDRIGPSASLLDAGRTIPAMVSTSMSRPWSPTGYRHSLGVHVSGESIDLPLDGLDAIASMRARAALPEGSGWIWTDGEGAEHHSGQESVTA